MTTLANFATRYRAYEPEVAEELLSVGLEYCHLVFHAAAELVTEPVLEMQARHVLAANCKLLQMLEVGRGICAADHDLGSV